MTTWIKTTAERQPWLTSIEVTATNQPDRTMRFFRVSKNHGKWNVDVVLPLRSYGVQFHTRRQCYEFVDTYCPGLDDLDGVDCVRGKLTSTGYLVNYRYDVHGYGPGWMRFHESWFDVALEVVQATA